MDKQNGTKRYFIFIVICMVFLVVPFAAMPFTATDTGQNEDRSQAPQLFIDGQFNTSFLQQAGDYFTDNFAFRKEYIDVDAHLKADVFQTSNTENVVVGTDGWLYYSGALADYQRTSAMSGRALENAASNIALMQEYLEGQGKTFVFAIAPDKASMASQHLPYYLIEGPGESNLDRIEGYLSSYDVNYVNLKKVLQSKSAATGRELYLTRDSHWNNIGALYAYDALLTSIGKKHDTYAGATPVMRDDWDSDVSRMLYPVTKQTEDQWYYDTPFTYVNDAADVEDNSIVTESGNKLATGSLVMYRDSFGNALLPFMANAYETAYFSKMIPYYLPETADYDADTVIVERAERHIAFFATTPPYMPAPERFGIAANSTLASDTTIMYAQNGPYLQVQGEIDGRYANDAAHVYIRITDGSATPRVFEAFRISLTDDTANSTDSESDNQVLTSDNGYRIYLPNDDLPSYPINLEVIISDGKNSTVLASRTIERTD